MPVRETPYLVPPRASAIPRPKTFHISPERKFRRIVGTSTANAIPQVDDLQPTLTTKQIVQIARIFDHTVEDDLAEGRAAWKACQSTRKRDGVYPFLTAVFGTVGRWKMERRAKAKSRQALKATGHGATIRNLEPFGVIILCTSDPGIADAKTRSKWSRALRYAERFEPDTQGLVQFIKTNGGLNECASRFRAARSR